MKADVIVIGLGAMGAAATYQLARRGAAVIGIDRYSPPHGIGSTHGDTRVTQVTRLATVEGAEYVPLVSRSHEIWRELESATGRSLLSESGFLQVAPAGAEIHGATGMVETSAAFATRFGIGHEVLDAAALRSRFPQFAVRDDHLGYFENRGGFVRPEMCIEAQLTQASEHGARVLVDTQVVDVEQTGAGVRITTKTGEIHEGGTAILATGQWIGALGGPRLASLLTVRREVLYWFDMEPDAYPSLSLPAMPVYIWIPNQMSDMIYGFPAIDGPDGGIKISADDYTTLADPDAPRIPASTEETRAMYDQRIGGRLRGVTSRALRTVTCHYTLTPDYRFIIDRHPEHDRMIMVSACSGHGFKHSAAIGEAAAQLALGGRSEIDLTPFQLARFA